MIEQLSKRAVQSFLVKVNVQDKDVCWLWTGPRLQRGYGTFAFRHNGVLKCGLAHRLSYEYYVAPIPHGLVIDHLCKNPQCVNPHHLETVTQYENSQRGDSWRWQLKKTHCPHGHAYNKTNTYVYSNGRRKCKICRKIGMRNRKKALQ